MLVHLVAVVGQGTSSFECFQFVSEKEKHRSIRFPMMGEEALVIGEKMPSSHPLGNTVRFSDRTMVVSVK